MSRCDSKAAKMIHGLALEIGGARRDFLPARRLTLSAMVSPLICLFWGLGFGGKCHYANRR